MATVPPSWLPKCDMSRIVLHWTAGGYKASSTDKAHYHIMIEDNGKLVRGDHTIDDNVTTNDDDYAAHTRMFNTRCIGISVCCMADAEHSPFKAGAFPMTKTQWETMAEVTAQVAKFYGIPIDEKHILGHGEVQRVHGIKQNGKWDPLVLPWSKGLTMKQVGDAFRDKVRTFP